MAGIEFGNATKNALANVLNGMYELNQADIKRKKDLEDKLTIMKEDSALTQANQAAQEKAKSENDISPLQKLILTYPGAFPAEVVNKAFPGAQFKMPDVPQASEGVVASTDPLTGKTKFSRDPSFVDPGQKNLMDYRDKMTDFKDQALGIQMQRLGLAQDQFNNTVNNFQTAQQQKAAKDAQTAAQKTLNDHYRAAQQWESDKNILKRTKEYQNQKDKAKRQAMIADLWRTFPSKGNLLSKNTDIAALKRQAGYPDTPMQTPKSLGVLPLSPIGAATNPFADTAKMVKPPNKPAQKGTIYVNPKGVTKQLNRSLTTEERRQLKAAGGSVISG